MRQSDFRDLSAHRLKIRNRLADRLFYVSVHPLDEVFLRQTDLEALHVLGQCLRIIGHGRGAGGRIHRIVSGDDIQHMRAIRHIARHGADLVERRRIGDETIARDAAIRWLHADDAAERRRLADRAARIGAERPDRHTCSDRRRAAARTAAGHAVEIPRIVRLLISGILCRTAHRELIHVELA